jgi:hypothetical protein
MGWGGVGVGVKTTQKKIDWPRCFYAPGSAISPEPVVLKGLSYEIDFENVDEN